MNRLRGSRRRSVLGWPARVLLAVVILAANALGVAVVTALALWALPTGRLPNAEHVKLLNLSLVPVYAAVAAPAGMLWVALQLRARVDDPRAERRLVLYGPLRIALVQALFWFMAAMLFGALNVRYSLRLGLAIGEVILIGGITTCAMAYLLAERILRPTAMRVLAGEPPRGRRATGVLVRSVLFWALGTAVPVTGLLVAGIAALAYGDVPASQLAMLVVAAGVVALLTGLVTTLGSARAIADPVRTVRRALQRVEQGDLSASVPVYDSTELGQLQAGFNTMVAGLRERDRIRDLFGRQVGHEVAHAATEAEEVRLGGEVRTVAVLFVDLVGSTGLAASREPTEVVELLNDFFGVVVAEVERCGGWINKFEGDAALAVFGAPTASDDPAAQALTTARRLAARLRAEVPDVDVGIGVSGGEAVAGYVGNMRRYEYTVIGDPVNEAARLTELAKTVPGRVLASGRAVRMAAAEEAHRWRLGETTTLRGRAEPTVLATPEDEPSGATRAGHADERPELGLPSGTGHHRS
jgi:adenylate cyclase